MNAPITATEFLEAFNNPDQQCLECEADYPAQGIFVGDIVILSEPESLENGSHIAIATEEGTEIGYLRRGNVGNWLQTAPYHLQLLLDDRFEVLGEVVSIVPFSAPGIAKQ